MNDPTWTVGSLEASNLPPTLSVPAAGRLLGLGRAASYEASARGDLDTLQFGRRKIVPTASILRKLQIRNPAFLNNPPQ